MKLFVYKTLFIFFCFIIAYKFTCGSLLNQFETRLKNFASKQNISMTKKKIKEELNSAIEKDRILKKDEAILIKKFLEKVSTEINQAY
jgi:hypothetical protein